MINQKEENNNFQDQLTELKKEKSIISQMIVATFKRSENLLGEVGAYWYYNQAIYSYNGRSIFMLKRWAVVGEGL